MPGRTRGFSLLEAFLALALVSGAMLVLLSVFSLSSGHARLTRDAVLARMVATSVQDEILAQGLGQNSLIPDWVQDRAAGGWRRTYEFSAQTEGRPAQPLHYDVLLTRSSRGNGAFFRSGASQQDYDTVTVVIQWHEPKHNDVEQLNFEVTVLNR